ncbi:leucine-rich repeat protein [Muricauda sp. SCSIO 64092]|uniref:leucine-rich repeat protein n=1 Tax=Allomuricauda sp. SCSIO 64092 TaxID=2908842 RepID=UPI001FF3A0F5|nr:leucine-rich repeat protein [Muricauda sp. SCSIO 64092]UOY07234.1 leucine-rich repeat protein [Muricauda sp. SCSIO 64092]
MKKQLHLVLLSIFLTGLTAYGQNIGGQFTVDGIRYKITDTAPTQVEIVAYTGSAKEVNIPPRVSDQGIEYEVTRIGENAFYGDLLTSVIIPEGITHIGIRAFMNNDINSVVIPTTVTSIGHTAFWNNRIASLEIPEGIDDIGDNTFGRNNLASVTIPASVTSIGGNAFITHPHSPSRMTQVTMLGSTPPVLQGDPFTNPGQMDLVVPRGALDAYKEPANGWTGFGSITYGIFTVDGSKYGITSETAVIMMDHTGTSTEVTILPTISHDGTDYDVTAIGDRVFHNKQLTKVTFINTPSTPSKVTSIGEDAFYKNQLTGIVIPESVTSLGQRAFGTNQLDSVAIPDGITSIGQWVFAQNKLTAVTIPGHVESIGYQAFYGNPNLGLVTVKRNDPPGLDADAFQNPNRDQIDVVVPKGTRQGYLDNGWTGFRSITEPVKIGDTFIVDHITYRVNSIDPDKEVTVIDYDTAGGPSLIIPPRVSDQGTEYKVTRIGERAFYGDLLTSVIIPEGITHIGIRAFMNNAINSVVIPTTVTSIGHTAFWNNRIASLEIPEGIDDIGDNTFGRNNLASVTIPASVTSIGTDAFITHPDSPSRMTQVTMLGSTPPVLQGDPFTNPGQIDLVVPWGALDVYKEPTNGWTGFGSITYGVFTVDGIKYEITSQTDVMVMDHTGTSTEVTILPTISHDGTDYDVTAIGDRAFHNKQLTKVTFINTPSTPSKVTSIGEDAFYKNQLASIVIPESVTSLGQRAFGTNQLDSVTIPDGITSIGQWVFAQNKLTAVTVPGHVESIGYQAFYGNPGLSLVKLEANGPPTLNADAFQYAGRDQIDLIVPPGTKDAYLAAGWTGFRSISFGIFTVDDMKYGITSPTEVMVMDHTGTATEVTITETVMDNSTNTTYTVTAIGNEAFKDKNLTGVTIPDGVTSIGDRAFWNNKLTEVTIPGSVTSIGQRAFGKNQLGSVIIPDGVTSIGVQAFLGNQLTQVTIPNTVTSMDRDAFQGNKLIEVTLPGNMTRLEEGVFKNNELTSVTIPDGVTSIGNSAFSQNKFITITISANVERIDQWAFNGSSSIHTIFVEATTPPSIEENTFGDRDQTAVVVPMDKRQGYLDNGWTGFKSISSGIFTVDGIKYGIISSSEVMVLDYISPVAVVTIPPTVAHGPNTYTVTTIGDYAFEKNHLTSVTIPNSVTSIGSDAFYGNQLTSVTIGNNVTRIGSGAFSTNQLTEVTIPGSVNSIGDIAFADNPDLATVITKATVPPSLHAGAFQYPGRHQIDLIVPSCTKDEYLAAGWTGFRSITEPEEGETFADGGIIYRITSLDPSTVTAIDYTGTATNVNIPEMVKGCYTVTTIGNEAFEEKGLTGVTIPNTVTSIGNYAFWNNELTEVTIPGSVTSIGEHAFFSNNLTEVTIGNGVISIGGRAFAHNELTRVTIPGSVRSIGEWAFTYNNLTEVTIGNSVTSIGEYAFMNNQLTSVTLPDSVTSIGEYAFFLNDLTEVTLPGNMTSIESSVFSENDLTSVTIPDSVTSIGNSAFSANDLTEVTIGNNVNSIGDFAFMNNQLTCATIPNSINSIGGSAFANNPDLAGVVTKATDPPALHADAFQNADRDQIDLIVPEGRTGAYLATGWTGFRSITEAKVGGTFTDGGITYQITSLEPYTVMVIDYTGTATDVNIPEMVKGCFTVTRIGDDAFRGGQLTSVVIPNSVTRIGNGAFASNNLTSVTIPNSVESIGYHAFGRNGLTAVTIPNGLTSIEQSTFAGNLLTNVTIPNSVTSIGEWAFSANDLTEVTIPGNVESIGYQAFYYNPNLGLVTVKRNDPPSLHADAFQNRSQIDLIVPVGRKNAYLAAGWTGFKSITEAAGMAGKSAVVQGTSAEASPVESAVAPAHVDVAKANARDNVSVYPNPAQDDIHIGLPDGEALRQVNLYNALGVHVHSANTLQLDIGHLPSGTYIMEIETRAGERVVKRIIVK